MSEGPKQTTDCPLLVEFDVMSLMVWLHGLQEEAGVECWSQDHLKEHKVVRTRLAASKSTELPPAEISSCCTTCPAECKGRWLCLCYGALLLEIMASMVVRGLAGFRGVISAVRTVSNGFKDEELKLLSSSKVGKPIRAYLPNPDNDFGSAQQTARRLLVLMIGWAQSRQNALSKYASIYTQLGFPCIAVATPVPLMWFTSLGSNVTRNVLGLLDESLEVPVSLLFHIFSGGGTVLFPQLLQEYTKTDSPFPSKLCPVGVVFDSGPSEFSRRSGLAASKLAYKQGGFNVFTYSLANTAGTCIDIAIGSKKRSEEEAALTHPHLLQVPQLYLYSEQDSVNPSERARMVMEGQRARGREITSKCWTDTEHVRHFSKHPEEYNYEIVNFLESLHNIKT